MNYAMHSIPTHRRQDGGSPSQQHSPFFVPFVIFVAKTHPAHTPKKTFFARALALRSRIW